MKLYKSLEQCEQYKIEKLKELNNLKEKKKRDIQRQQEQDKIYDDNIKEMNKAVERNRLSKIKKL